MDIQDELTEAWEGDSTPEDKLTAGTIGDVGSHANTFALGYLACKRRLGVSKPDRRAELLVLAGKIAAGPIMTTLGQMPIGRVGWNAVIMAKAMLEEIDDTATQQD